MYVGCQNMNLTDMELRYMVRHGVYHADMNVDDMQLETLQAAVAMAAAYGVSLEMIHIEPYIAGGRGMAAITAAEEPGREEGIQSILRMIENAGRAGIRGLNYNFHPIGDHGSGNQRTADTLGRGGARQSTFSLEEYLAPAPGGGRAWSSEPTPLGPLSRETVYERARCF